MVINMPRPGRKPTIAEIHNGAHKKLDNARRWPKDIIARMRARIGNIALGEEHSIEEREGTRRFVLTVGKNGNVTAHTYARKQR